MDVPDGKELALTRTKKREALIIKEKHQWKKLYGQKEAKLIGTSHYFVIENAPACHDFIQYNQETVDGQTIHLSEGPYYVLRFIGDKQIPFTILRRQNYEAMKFYESHIGDSFKIEVTDG